MKFVTVLHLVVFVIYTGNNIYCEGQTYAKIDDKKTWEDAKQDCITRNGQLAILDSLPKIVQARLSISRDTAKQYWVGLRCDVSGQLYWSSGEPTSWMPIDSKSNPPVCYYLKHSGYIVFMKNDCNSSLGYICEVTNSTGSTQVVTTQHQTTTITEEMPSASTFSATGHSLGTSTGDPNSHTTVYNATLPSTVPLSQKETVSLSSLYSQTKLTNLMESSASQVSRSDTLSLTPAPLSRVSSEETGHPGTFSPSSTTTANEAQDSILESTPSLLSMVAMTTMMSSFEHAQSVSTSVNSLVMPTTTTTQFGAAGTSSSVALTSSRMMDEFQEITSHLEAKDPGSLEVLAKSYDKVVEKIQNLDEEEVDSGSRMSMAHEIEAFAMDYAKLHLNGTGDKIQVKNSKIDIEMVHVDSMTIKEDLRFPSQEHDRNEAQITLPLSLFKENRLIVNILYNDTLKTSTITDEKKRKLTINTKIISSSIFPAVEKPFDEEVTIVLRHLKATEVVGQCVFWNPSKVSNKEGAWSNHGCHTVTSSKTQTTCACNHLTNFAVLMQLRSAPIPHEHKVALTAISYVGLLLSLLGEFVTFVTYLIFLNRQNEKTQIRVNLVATMATAQIMLLSGINATTDKVLCITVAAMVHYFYLVSFCWMLIEGVFLYRLVVKVFQSNMKMKYCYDFCYGFPAVVVAGSLFTAAFLTGGIHSYVNEDFCWISLKSHLIWTFVGPVLLMTMINAILLVTVIREMSSMQSVKTVNSCDMTHIKASVRACVILLPLFGVTWLFGLLTLGDVGVVGQYIFTILNSTQGFMIFIFHCVRSSELKAAIHLKILKWDSTSKSRSESNSPFRGKPLNTSLATSAPNKVIPLTVIQNRVPAPNVRKQTRIQTTHT